MSDELREQAALIVTTMPRLMRQLFSLDEDDPAAKLSVAQLRVCALLSEAPLPMSAISRELGMSLSAMTQIADRLERAGFVQRVRHEDDRRVRVLTLTARAQRIMRLRRERRVERVMGLLEPLPGEARESLSEALKVLDAVSSRSLLEPDSRAKGGGGDASTP